MAEITPSDVFQHVGLLAEELELIRQEMGRPKDGRAELSVKGALPRNAYFEALTLFRKCDRLCFERTGEQAVLALPPPVDAIRPMHVRAVVDAAITRLRQVKARLGIAERPAAPPPVSGKQPSDVIVALTRANRQINVLLEQPFSPSDCYQLMTMAVGYAAVLLARVGGEVSGLPAFERRKRPGDVHRRVWGALGKLRQVCAAIGHDMFEVAEPALGPDEITPSDVYDLGSLLLAELVYLHSRVPDLGPPAASEFYEVGHKLPAHVFQMVGYLEGHLDALLAAAQRDPKSLG